MLFLISYSKGIAQNQIEPVSLSNPTINKNPLLFIPEGFVLLDSVSGNLNLDSIPDIILVVKRANEEESSDAISNPSSRPLIILQGTLDGFKLAARNDKTVYCFDCGGMMGDPYNGTTIGDGFFKVAHYGGSGWRWIRQISYKYSSLTKNWFLHEDLCSYFHSSDPEKEKREVKSEKNFGKIKFEDFDIYLDEK